MINRSTKILFVIAVGLLMLKIGISAAVFLWPPAATPTIAGSAGAQTLIDLTNAYRQGLDLPQLIVNSRLTQAAVNKAKNILAEQYFSHTSPEGKKFSDWIKEVNYAYFYVGENLAIDFSSPQDTFSAWLNSPTHKANIVRPEFQEIGVADLTGKFNGRETSVVVQIFGSRVLGANEATAGIDNVTTNVDDYFAQPSVQETLIKFLESMNGWLNYLLFGAIILLILSWLYKKRLPHKTTVAKTKTSNMAATTAATTSIQPPQSLYTRRTQTANERQQTVKNTLQPDTRKRRQ
jgi:uncharacterized protein YkwD